MRTTLLFVTGAPLIIVLLVLLVAGTACNIARFAPYFANWLLRRMAHEIFELALYLSGSWLAKSKEVR